MSSKEKEERRKLYQENKELYKKVRAQFIYGISKDFRERRKNEKKEIEDLEEENYNAYQEDL